MFRAVVTVLSCWCVVACASAPAPVLTEIPPELQRYADASAFVPDGLVSHAFVDARWLVKADSARAAGLMVFAGRDFQHPSPIGLGAFTGVFVHDVGTGGDPRTLLTDDEIARRVPSGTIDGRECFHVTANPTDGWLPRWYTVVDGRFLVRASSPQMLAEALQRRGALADILAPFAPLPTIADKSVCTIWNLPRDVTREPHAELFSVPVPDQPTISVFTAQPWLLQIMAREPLSECYRKRAIYTFEREIAGTGPWRGFEARVWEPATPASMVYFTGQCCLLFGVPLAL